MYILDKLGMIVLSDTLNNFYGTCLNELNKYLHECPWYKLYDVIEYYFTYLDNIYQKEVNKTTYQKVFSESEKKINTILEEEKSAFRVINGYVCKITNEVEIESIAESTHTAFPTVNTHLNKALKLYSDRLNPDYENSI